MVSRDRGISGWSSTVCGRIYLSLRKFRLTGANEQVPYTDLFIIVCPVSSASAFAHLPWVVGSKERGNSM